MGFWYLAHSETASENFKSFKIMTSLLLGTVGEDFEGSHKSICTTRLSTGQKFRRKFEKHKRRTEVASCSASWVKNTFSNVSQFILIA